MLPLEKPLLKYVLPEKISEQDIIIEHLYMLSGFLRQQRVWAYLYDDSFSNLLD